MRENGREILDRVTLVTKRKVFLPIVKESSIGRSTLKVNDCSYYQGKVKKHYRMNTLQ